MSYKRFHTNADKRIREDYLESVSTSLYSQRSFRFMANIISEQTQKHKWMTQGKSCFGYLRQCRSTYPVSRSTYKAQITQHMVLHQLGRPSASFGRLKLRQTKKIQTCHC